MAGSPVELANMALTHLGQQVIAALTDDNDRARAATARYLDVRDSVLRQHFWNCAMKLASLAQLSTSPTWGFANAYQLPSDFLRLKRMEDIDVDFAIRGRELHTDADEANILYVYRLEDVSQMDDLLKQAIASRLAAEIAVKLTGSQGMRDRMLALYSGALAEAQFVDASESPVEQYAGVTWLDAHSGREPFSKIDTSQ